MTAITKNCDGTHWMELFKKVYFGMKKHFVIKEKMMIQDEKDEEF